MSLADVSDGTAGPRSRPPGSRVLVFCSSKGGTGRTTLVAGLALALGEAGHRVQLVDADAATRGLTHLLAGRGGPALETITLAGPAPAPSASAFGRPEDPGGAAAPGLQEPAARWRGRGFDYVLVDAPAGEGPGLWALAAVADAAVIVADPSSLRGGQERHLLEALAGWEAPCAVIVNRAPPGAEGPDLVELARLLGRRVQALAAIEVEAQVPAGEPLHAGLAADGPATGFATAALEAFDRVLRAEVATWTIDRRERWEALGRAKARAAARRRAQLELEAAAHRKQLDHWPELEAERTRLAAELARLCAQRAQDQIRQARLVESLREEGRDLRRHLEAARDHAGGVRVRGLGTLAMGAAAGAALALGLAVTLHPPGAGPASAAGGALVAQRMPAPPAAGSTDGPDAPGPARAAPTTPMLRHYRPHRP